MAQFTVPLEGGGSMTVNASSYAAAEDNVRSTGNTPQGSGGGGGGGGGGGTTAGTTPSGEVTYNTVNGPRTLAQMNDELRAVGWGGPTYGGGQESTAQAIADAYARTTGGTVNVNQGSVGSNVNPSGTVVGAPQPNTTLTDREAANAALRLKIDQAAQAANAEYMRARINLDSDRLAFDKAQKAFENSLAEAGVLGVYQGQTTLAAQNQYFNQAFQLQQQNQKVVQDYLSLLSGLRGPQDYGQYLRVMASTPQGLQSLVAAAAGQQPAATFGTTGVAPVPVTLGGFMGAAAGAPSGATGATPGTTYADYQAQVKNLPPPSQIAPQNWNALTDTQKQLLLGMYESSGWNITDALQQYQASLPKFQQQTGSVRLV